MEPISMLLMAVNLLIGGFSSVLWASLKEAKFKAELAMKELSEYKTFCAANFVTNDDLHRSVNKITEAFEKLSDKFDKRFDTLETKLDRKADRPQ